MDEKARKHVDLDHLQEEFIKQYTDKIALLSGASSEIVEDNSLCRDAEGLTNILKDHIVYKLVLSDGRTFLESKDHHRRYEFVIEFDRKDFAYGIYYGCKGIICSGEEQEQIDLFYSEWESIKDEVVEILNNTFPQKNFFPRLKTTNNHKDRTFWPFWIPLYDDEDIYKVAVRAIRIISRIYTRMLHGETEKKDSSDCSQEDQSKLETLNTNFTEEAYESVKNLLETEDQDLLNLFLNESGLFEKDERYELCWRVSNETFDTKASVKIIIKNFLERIGGVSHNHKWKLFIPILLSYTGERLTSLKALHYNTNNSRGEDMEKICTDILEKCFPPKK